MIYFLIFLKNFIQLIKENKYFKDFEKFKYKLKEKIKNFKYDNFDKKFRIKKL